MKKHILRALAVLLMACLGVGVLAACGDDEEPAPPAVTTYTVEFSLGEPSHAAAGVTAPPSQTGKAVGDTIPLTTPAAAENWKFDGWHTVSGKVNGTAYTVAAADAVEGTITLTAQWADNTPAPAPTTYTVTFNVGTNGTVAQGATANYTEKAAGDEVDIPAVTAKKGYTFDGWYKEDNTTKLTGNKYTIAAADADADTAITFTAHYTAISYKVHFDVTKPAGASGTVEGTVPTDTAITITNRTVTFPTGLSLEGYNFSGWKLGTGTVITAATYTVTEAELPENSAAHELTFVAQWTPKTYRVTFEEGAHGALDNDYSYEGKRANDELAFPASPAADAGYRFTGWYNRNGNRVDGPDMQVYTVSADDAEGTDITITARYETIKYTIVFESGADAGVTGSVDSVENVTVEEYEVSLADKTGYSRTGYDFDGWTLNGDDVGDIFNLTEDLIPDGTEDGTIITLTAKWTARTYRVELDAGDNGTLTDGAVEATYDAPLDLSQNDPTADKGYTFKGWFTAEEGGTEFESGSDWTTDESAPKLYAQYEEIAYTVKFDVTTPLGTVSGEHADAEITVTDRTVTFPTELTLTGYTLTGWKLGVGEVHMGSYEVTVAELPENGEKPELIFVAQWAAKRYQVALEAGEKGALSETAVQATYNEPLTLPTVTANKGYTFKGWFTAEEGGTKFESGAAWTTDESAPKLYAQYEMIAYTVKFDVTTAHGTVTGEHPDASITITDRTVTFPAGLALTGYTLTGWKLGAGAERTDETYEVTVAELPENGAKPELTFVAQWAPKTYTVTLEAGTNGTLPENTVEATYNAPLDLSQKDPTANKGYTFKGWFTAEEGGDEFPSGTAWTTDGEALKLYARYTYLEYTVEYSKGEAQSEPSDMPAGTAQKVSLQEGHTTITLPSTDPKLEGFLFEGWSLNGNNIGKAGAAYDITADDLPTNPENAEDAKLTLVALWKEEGKVLVTYQLGEHHASDASLPRASENVVKNGTLTLPTETDTLKGETGYAFDGWYIEDRKLGATEQVAEEDITVTAKFKAIAYTVEFAKGEGDVQGTIGSVAVTIEAGGNAVALSDKTGYTRTDYVLTGWKFNDANTYAPDGTFTLTAAIIEANGGKTTITLTAQWEKKAFTVTYVYGEGAAEAAPKEASYKWGAAVPLPEPAAQPGFAFEAWEIKETEGNGTVEVSEAEGRYTFPMPKYNVTVTAKFKAIEYVVKYELNAQAYGTLSGAIGSGTISKKADLTLPDDPTLTGYAFAGWKIAGRSGTVDHADGTLALTDEMIAQAADGDAGEKVITLTAQWTMVTYTVKYAQGENVSDAEGMPKADGKISWAEELALPADPARTGYTFAGWQVAGHTEKLFKENDALALTDAIIKGAAQNEITLTATWTMITYTVKYASGVDGDTGVSGMPEQDGEISWEKELTLPADPARTGYTFAGWQVTGVGEAVNGTLALTADIIKGATAQNEITLTATWTPKTYRVTLVVGTGTLSETTVTATYDAPLTLEEPTANKGYTFKGWFTAEEGGDEFTSGSAWTTDGENLKLYAQYEEIIYTVIFDVTTPFGTVSGAHANAEITITDRTVTFPAGLTLTGYTLTGWKLGEGATHAGSYEVTVAELPENGAAPELTFVAQWTPKMYTVTLEAGANGTLSNNTVEATYDAPLDLSGKDPTANKGYKFDAWYTAEEGGEKFTSGSAWTTDGEGLKLYARYTYIEYTVEFSKGAVDGDVALPSVSGKVSLQEGHNTIELSAVSFAGFLFEGWQLNGRNIGLTGAYLITEADLPENIEEAKLILTAQWREVTEVLVTYKLGEHAASDAAVPPAVEAKKNGTLILPEAPPAAKGYEFDGWYVEGGNTKAGNAKGAYTVGTQAVTLIGKFKAIAYTVKYESGVTDKDTKVSGMPTQNGSISLDAPLKLPAGPTRTGGYKFAGWQAAGMAEAATGTLTLTEDMIPAQGTEITLTATWKGQYTVKFDLGGHGTGEAPETAYDKAIDDEVRFTTPEGEVGWEFDGWYVKNTWGDTAVVGDVYIVSADDAVGYIITLTAHWKQKMYTVTYEYGEGADDEEPEAQHVTGGTVVELPEAPMAKEGYEFAGWEVKQTEGGTIVEVSDDEEKYFFTMPMGDVTVTAKWMEILCTVEFYDGEGEEGNLLKTLTYAYDSQIGSAKEGESYKDIKTTKDGHEITGWYYLKGEEHVAVGESFTPSDHADYFSRILKLYAVWKHNYVKGKCSHCQDVCTHENLQDSTCPDCGVKFVAFSDERAYTDNFGKWGVGALTDYTITAGEHIILNATYADGGEKEYNGVVVRVAHESTEMYFIRPAGDSSRLPFSGDGEPTSWGASYGSTRMAQPGYHNEPAYINLKKTGRTQIEVVFEGNTLTVTYRLYNEDGSLNGLAPYTMTWTISNMPESSYKIGFGADGCTLTPEGARIAYYKWYWETDHVCDYNNGHDHHCATCGKLDPDVDSHHNYTAYGHLCTLCGKVDPEIDRHHNYDPVTGKCDICDAMNPAHVHNFDSGDCTCGAKKVTATDGGRNYEGVAVVIDGYKNNDTDWGWWNGSTDDIKLAGDFVVIFEWDNLNDKGFALDAVFEINEDKADAPGYLDVDVVNINNCNVWGALIKEYVAEPPGFTGDFLAGKNATQSVEGSNTLETDPWGGHYVCTVTRIGTTIKAVTVFRSTDKSVTVTNTITLTGMLTDAVVCRIAGNPAPLSNFKAWSGTLTAQD